MADQSENMGQVALPNFCSFSDSELHFFTCICFSLAQTKNPLVVVVVVGGGGRGGDRALVIIF